MELVGVEVEIGEGRFYEGEGLDEALWVGGGGGEGVGDSGGCRGGGGWRRRRCVSPGCRRHGEWLYIRRGVFVRADVARSRASWRGASEAI